jgi:NADH-quinone oxidoreductase subunit J
MFFDVFNFFMLMTAFFVIITANQVHALFCLISVFIQMTVLLLVYYQFEFFPFIIIIVYIGAIAILFLFVVMMLDINVPSNATNKSLLGLSLFLIFVGYLLAQTVYFHHTLSLSVSDWKLFTQLVAVSSSVQINPSDQLGWQDLITSDTDLKAISEILYTSYSTPFLLSAYVLLVAMLGAISLTLKQKPYVKRQLVIEQNHRNFEKTVRRVTVK